jgi:hypothetical protein
MTTIKLQAKTSATPEQFIAALTDFGPGRAELFGNSADKYMKIHDRANTQADVTEGSNGVWERLHYDWSNPTHVVLTTTDSNAWGRNSGHTYDLTVNPEGTTTVDYTAVREGKNLRGRFLEVVVRSIGKSVIVKAFHNTVKAIDARTASRKAAE